MKEAVLACAAPTVAAAAARGCHGGGGGGVVMVRRATLAACVSCVLCKRLLRDATTISECLHTCSLEPATPMKILSLANLKCIFEKFTDQEMSCCPICNINLGRAPLEKLRADRSLQYVRAMVFPFKRQKIEAAEVTSRIALPVRRKERSLSSLTAHVPQVSIQKCLTRRRTRASGLRGFSVHSTLGSSKATEKIGGWRALNCLTKVAKDEKAGELSLEEVVTSEVKPSDTDAYARPDQAKTQMAGGKVVPSIKGKSKRFKTLPGQKGKAKRFKTLPGQKRRLRAIWCFLAAAFDQKGHPPLPQLPTKYLRIKDVDLPASFIQKYLLQKLNLSSEAEVEMTCRGKLVSPGITLHDLAKCWLDVGPKRRLQLSVGSRATEFVMTIVYRRPKSPSPCELSTAESPT